MTGAALFGAPARAQDISSVLHASETNVTLLAITTAALPQNSLLFPPSSGGSAKTGIFASQELTALVEGKIAGVDWRVRLEGLAANEGSSGLRLRLNDLSRDFDIGDVTLSIGKETRIWDVAYSAQPVGFFQSQ